MSSKKKSCHLHNQEALKASVKIQILVSKEMKKLGICGLETRLSFKFGKCYCFMTNTDLEVLENKRMMP